MSNAIDVVSTDPSARHNRVVVCGAGMAGLCAALAALEAGAEVTVIEKASAIGGSFALSGGKIWTYEDYDSVRRRVPGGDPVLQELVVDRLPDDLDWLRSLGVRMGPLEPLVIGRGRRADPRQALEAMAGTIRASGGTIVFDTALESLNSTDRGLTLRTIGMRRDDLAEMPCASTVLSTGGFQGGSDLIWSLLGVRPHDLLLRSNSHSRGDALLAAVALGAGLADGLQSFYGHALAQVSSYQETTACFRGLSQYYGQNAVALNIRGERFADESIGTGDEILNEELARQPRARGFYIVDHESAETVKLPDGEPCLQAIRRAADAGARVITAATIEELVDALAAAGLPKRRVEATLFEFNDAMASRSPLYPPRSANRRGLTEPPFYAVPVRAAITFTCGGLAVDPQMRVLRRSSLRSEAFRADQNGRSEQDVASVIARLYAAGTDVGNISAVGYVGGLATALVTGRIAGREAAQNIS